MAGGLVQTAEFPPIPAIRRMLATQGTTVPATGAGSIDYVIAAYNNFETDEVGGVERQLFGFEWALSRVLPADADLRMPRPFFRCSGVLRRPYRSRTVARPMSCVASAARVHPLRHQVSNPIRSGQAFVSIRTHRAFAVR